LETDEDEQTGFPAAMNQSIYIMLGVPYLALGVFGVMIYRGAKKNEAHVLATREDGTQNDSPA
jgi:hypothetical protein